MVMEGDVTLGCRHTVRYTDHVLYKYKLGAHIILLTNVPLINLIKKKKISCSNVAFWLLLTPKFSVP